MSEATVSADLAIRNILASAGVTFNVRFVAETTKENDWECDQWSIVLKKDKNIVTTEFFTGIGLRAEPTKLAEMQAKSEFPGLSARDLKNNTIYARRYRAALEKLRKPAAPDAASVFNSLVREAEAIDQSFDDWASELGYDTDSIKALNTYNACCTIGKQLRQLFTRAQIAAMRDALQDY